MNIQSIPFNTWVDVNEFWDATEVFDSNHQYLKFPIEALDQYCLLNYGMDYKYMRTVSREYDTYIQFLTSQQEFIEEHGIITSINENTSNMLCDLKNSWYYGVDRAYKIYGDFLELQNLTPENGHVDIDDIIKNVPEWVEYNRLYDEYDNMRDTLIKSNSFLHSELCRPGVLIEVQLNDNIDDEGNIIGDNNIQHFLLGHTNIHGGICDDCMRFGPNAKVLRAKIVYIPE